MDIAEKVRKKKDWVMIGCLVPPGARDDIQRQVKSNREKYPKEDDRCSVSGLLRLWINEKLYPIPKKEDGNEKEVLKLA